jgi:hypothetical protein
LGPSLKFTLGLRELAGAPRNAASAPPTRILHLT